jgi:DNA-binding transcriptional LysR family regulator
MCCINAHGFFRLKSDLPDRDLVLIVRSNNGNALLSSMRLPMFMEIAMDIRELRYFVEVVRHNGFGRATEALHVTQPAISRGIKQLEEELGQRLLIREPKAIRLTNEGVILLRHARLILQQVGNLRSELRDAGTAVTGTLRVGLPPGVGSTFFAEVITEFRARCPLVELQIAEFGTNQMENALREGLVEIAAAMLPLDAQQYESQRFATEKLVLVIERKHRLARMRSVRLRNLAAETFVLLTEDFRINDLLCNACGLHGFAPKVAGRSSHFDFVIAMVGAGMGVTVLPKGVWDQNASPEFAAIPITNPTLSYEIALIRRVGGYLSRSCLAWISTAAQILDFEVAPRFTAQPKHE